MRKVTRQEVLAAADYCEAIADGRTVEFLMQGSLVHMLVWDMTQPDMMPPREAAHTLRAGRVPAGWVVSDVYTCSRCGSTGPLWESHACQVRRL